MFYENLYFDLCVYVPVLLCKILLTGQIINIIEELLQSLPMPAGAVAILTGQNFKADFAYM